MMAITIIIVNMYTMLLYKRHFTNQSIFSISFKLHFNLESESVGHSVVSYSATPQTTARQAPLVMGCSRQEYWSG